MIYYRFGFYLYIRANKKIQTMKKHTLALAGVILLSILMTGCYNRIGKLTMISTRNIDSKTDYVLLEKDVMGKAKAKKKDVIELAVDRAVKKQPTGEFMKNVIIEVSNSGKKIRVRGDVWGTPPNINIKTTVTANIEFKAGDKVTFKSGGKIVEGTILGVNEKNAVVETTVGEKKEVDYDKLTKIQR